jgi:hypothetical protein
VARYRWRFLLAALLTSAACDDDSSARDESRTSDGSAQRPRDGGLDASRDGSSPDGKTGSSDAAATIVIDAGEAGVITFVRTDGCPADAPLAVNRIRIYPAQGGGANLANTGFQGSNESSTGAGFVQVAAIADAAMDGQWLELTFENDTIYRWLRFFDPEGREAKIAEVEFYHDSLRLSGRSYGTVSAGSNDHPFDLAFDGKLDTYYSGVTAGGNYIGLDIAGDFIASAPTFSPENGALTGPSNITLATTTPNATIRYVTEAVDPTPTTGTAYSQPLRLETGTLMLRAIAVAPCYFASPISRARYGIGAAPVVEGQRTYHIGNSLTDTFEVDVPRIADSTGVEHEFARSTIPGATIGWLWDHRTGTSGKPEAANDVTSFVQSYAPIDQMTLQPFSDPEFSSQGPAAVNFFQLALQYSPNMQMWLYAQWPNSAPVGVQGGTPGYLSDPISHGQGDWAGSPTPVGDTWEDVTDAMLSYHEAFADYIEERIEGKKVRICPAGSALAALKRRIDKGMVPGQTDFFASTFARNSENPALPDELHLNDAGAYLVSLVMYSCFYRANPVEKVTYKPEGLSDELATLYKQIAWEVASGYPRAGIVTN